MQAVFLIFVENFPAFRLHLSGLKPIKLKKTMKTMIRFKLVELDSKVCFIGRKKKVLKYPVRSISLVPVPKSSSMLYSTLTVPEIFWQ